MAGLSLNLTRKQSIKGDTIAFKNYLVNVYNIQKVSHEELYFMFGHSSAYLENRETMTQNKSLEGLFYTKVGEKFISFRNLNGTCDAKDFSCEVKALCWLVGTC